MARKLRQLGAKPRRGLTLTSVSSRPRTCAAALLQRYRPGALNSPALGSRPARENPGDAQTAAVYSPQVFGVRQKRANRLAREG